MNYGHPDNSEYHGSYCTQDAEIERENKGQGEKVHHLKGDKEFHSPYGYNPSNWKGSNHIQFSHKGRSEIVQSNQCED